jgi:hypothetical protein
LKKFDKIITIAIILFAFAINVNAQEIDLHRWMTERSLEVNNWYCNLNSKLNESDKMTQKQAEDRANSIIKHANELNYMYPSIHPRRIAKDYFAIIEHETYFVNYSSLDQGQSLGLVAITRRTAEAAAEYFGDQFDRNNNNDVLKLVKDTDRQIKYGIWYYYNLLNRYYDGDRLTALVGYNVGPGLKIDEPRFRNYYFNIRGRLNYYEEQFQKCLNEGLYINKNQ